MLRQNEINFMVKLIICTNTDVQYKSNCIILYCHGIRRSYLSNDGIIWYQSQLNQWTILLNFTL